MRVKPRGSSPPFFLSVSNDFFVIEIENKEGILYSSAGNGIDYMNSSICSFI